ncbi:hypothetical protein M422DRAFT_262582 [Sphaerobolus stellatus SS14]|uniref:NADH:flavin oxidoreductase/NADH oxidase N-terminal domain-containing protein n=1 Tax=Sphaerobolus stellatus (strain SS14) TaxID=990650 RepID=A0A0C9UK00_SPHS4|nr:hypothetical protein M422DRAFT_262582 [Sphaerobolus stellatus SS14]
MSALMRSRSLPTNIPNETNVEYYKQRAHGDAGLIVTEGTLICQQGTEWPHTPDIYTAEHVAPWRKITDVVHAEGAKIFSQLWHIGRANHPDMPEQIASGEPVWAPSTISARGGKFGTLPEQPGYATPTELPRFYREQRYGDMGIPLEDTLVTFKHVITELDRMKLAYIAILRYVAVLDPVIDGRKLRGTQHDVITAYRPLIKNSKLIRNGGLTPSEAADLIQSGTIDAAAFGMPWISHPDMQKRFEAGKRLDEPIDFNNLYWHEGMTVEQGYSDYASVIA